MDEKNKNILAQARKRREEARIIEVEEEKIKLVIFSLAGDFYAFAGEDIKEILRVEKIAFVPGSPQIILGVINVRGDIESVLNIHKLLGLPDSQPTPNSRIIIAASAEVRSGILVDTVEDVTDVPAGSVQPPIATFDKSLKEFVVGVTEQGGHNVTILGIKNILGKLKVPAH